MRQWLYNKNAEPTIFTGQEAIDKALKDGWVDTPAAFKEKDAIEATVVTKVKAIEAIVVEEDNLDSLERDELYEMAKDANLKVPFNIGKKTLLARLRG